MRLTEAICYLNSETEEDYVYTHYEPEPGVDQVKARFTRARNVKLPLFDRLEK